MIILKIFVMDNVFLLIGVDQSLGTRAVTSNQFVLGGIPISSADFWWFLRHYIGDNHVLLLNGNNY